MCTTVLEVVHKSAVVLPIDLLRAIVLKPQNVSETPILSHLQHLASHDVWNLSRTSSFYPPASEPKGPIYAAHSHLRTAESLPPQVGTYTSKSGLSFCSDPDVFFVMFTFVSDSTYIIYYHLETLYWKVIRGMYT